MITSLPCGYTCTLHGHISSLYGYISPLYGHIPSLKGGVNLAWVAAHEFGHTLGLDHSNVKGSLMFAYYNGQAGSESLLASDDVSRIQAYYGMFSFHCIDVYSLELTHYAKITILRSKVF